MFRCWAMIFSVLSFLAVNAGIAHAAPQYAVTDLGKLSGVYPTYATGINALGQIAGGSWRSEGSSEYHAFLYSNGTLMDLSAVPGGLSHAYGIGDNGWVVGETYTVNGTSGYYHASFYTNGTTTDLGTFGGNSSCAYAINNIGQITGYADSHTACRPFLFSNGTMTDLGFNGVAYGINNRGEIVGWTPSSGGSDHAYLYSNGTLTDLGTLGGCQGFSQANDINDEGQIVGYSYASTGFSPRAFLYSNGTMTDLGALPNRPMSRAEAINNSGQVVGFAYGKDLQHAFLYSNGHIKDLNELIDQASGWTLAAATAINESGQIAGYGYNPAGETHAILLTPVPEPSTFVLLGVGALALAGYGCRRRTLHNSAAMLLAAMVVLAGGSAQADVFNMGGTRDPVTGTWTGSASLEFVTVGDPGNVRNTVTVLGLYKAHFGSVAYVFQIGKYDVTIGQYVQFLNAVASTSDPYGLYSTSDFSGNSMAPGSAYPTIGITRSGNSGNYSYSVAGSYSQAANCPIFDIGWGDAARFCNWLQNGQPIGSEGSGTTETGAYTLNGATTTNALMAVTRNAQAIYFIPSADEWYKAAYYKGGGTNSGYWAYPSRNDAVPSNVLDPSGTNNANFDYTDSVNRLTPVGAFASSPGPYGTYDQGGNIFQWNETMVVSQDRGTGGGVWYNGASLFASYCLGGSYPVNESYDLGFRVARIPEPSIMILLGLGAIGLLGYICRRRGRVRCLSGAAVVAAMLIAGSAQAANVFNMGGTRDPVTGTWTGLASLEFVTVGDPGNIGELSGQSVSGGMGPDRICGAVNYVYGIGKYEVTAGQYTEFLNVKAKSDPYGLYNTVMWTRDDGCKIQRTGSAGNYTYSVAQAFANRPVNYVTFWAASRFTNWLCNGQGDGSTETGAYTLNGYNGNDGRTIIRNIGAQWFLPSEDEWYKAAYYKGGGTNTGYWDYPTSSDTAPGRNLADPSGNNANYFGAECGMPIDSGMYTTTVGEFQNSSGPYGTFDQGGNIFEWNEAIVTVGIHGPARGLRGGAFGSYPYTLMGYSRICNCPVLGVYDYSGSMGFRVACIPEPGSLAMLLAGAVSLVAYAWRRRA